MFSPSSSYYKTELTPPEGEDDVPPTETYSMISITSYSEMREIIENFINSKRRARDAENNYHFLKAGPRSNCARVDAVYNVRAGVTSHIKVQDKDQYWAEEERKFPHLKEIHLQEEMSAVPQGPADSDFNTPKPSVMDVGHLFPTPETSPESAEGGLLTQSAEVMALKKTLEIQRLVPGTTRLYDGRPPSKKARLEKSGNKARLSKR